MCIRDSGLLTGSVQAYIFSILAAVYIACLLYTSCSRRVAALGHDSHSHAEQRGGIGLDCMSSLVRYFQVLAADRIDGQAFPSFTILSEKISKMDSAVRRGMGLKGFPCTASNEGCNTFCHL